MGILRSPSEQVADYLRSEILHARLMEPLPNTRDWSKQLEVGRDTLCTALRILEREGFIANRRRRGFELLPLRRRPCGDSTRNVLVQIRYWPEFRGYHHGHSSLWPPFEPMLHAYGMEYREEDWTDADFRTFERTRGARPASQRELFLLPSLPAKFLSPFIRVGQPCLLLGVAPPSMVLPYIALDWAGAVRHATFYLARRGFRQIILLIRQSNSPGVARCCETFLGACREAPDRPFRGEIMRPVLALAPQIEIANRVALRAKERLGIVLAGPLSAGVLMTTLLGRGIRIPQQVEIVVTNALPEILQVNPVPAHYPYPWKAWMKAVAKAAVQFFETGKPPRVQKLIPVEIVRPGAT